MENLYSLLGYNSSESESKLIYYYQTFTSLQTLSGKKYPNTYVYVSSLHFGKDSSGLSYIHLNNSDPESQIKLWQDVKLASDNGINILVMLGGAGGAYSTLFTNDSSFETYYKLLHDFLKKYPFIKGIDLDVEESVDIFNIIKLIARLDYDFGKDFIITMAPVVWSMETDTPGLGGFSYKDLSKTMEGKRINWFNVQCYGNYTSESYDAIIKNGYSPDKIVFGMLGDNYTPDTFQPVLNEIKKIKKQYNDLSGIMMWEYGDTKINPIDWGKDISNIISLTL